MNSSKTIVTRTMIIATMIMAFNYDVAAGNNIYYEATDDAGMPVKIFPNDGPCWKGKNSLTGTIAQARDDGYGVNKFIACLVPNNKKQYDIYVKGHGYYSSMDINAFKRIDHDEVMRKEWEEWNRLKAGGAPRRN